MLLTMDARPATELDLVRAAIGGDPAAREALVDRYYGPVVALASRLLGDRAEARDAAQETFLRAFRRLDSYRPDQAFAPWLLSIAANYSRDRLRRRASHREVPPLEEADARLDLPPELPLETEEDLARVRRAVDGLPTDLRIAVVLLYQQGLAPAAAAQALGVSVNAFRLRLYRALGQLRAALRETTS